MSQAPVPPTPGRKRLNLHEMMWWHEAGHVWACWKAKVRVREIGWQGVDHDDFAEGWPALRNYMAGIAVIGLKYNLSFEEAFLFGGAVAGDGPSAVGQALEHLRPGEIRVPYEDEIPGLWKLIGSAFNEIRSEMDNPAAMKLLGDIVAQLAKLPNANATMTGDELALALGRSSQF